VKLYLVQVVHSDIYTTKADHQYVTPNVTIFNRGNIFFSTKDGTEIGAATIKNGFLVAVNPKKVTDPTSAYSALASIIEHSTTTSSDTSSIISRDAFLAKATKKDDSYEEIIKKLDTPTALTLSKATIPGISVYKSNWRFYPGGTMASQVIGITGQSKNTATTSDVAISGKYGLERYYEDTLTRDSNVTYVNFFAEMFADIKGTVFNTSSLEGDIVTTIDPTVQNYLETVLDKTAQKWKPDEIGGIVIDPKTGAIYGIAHLPTFNANDLSSISDPKIFSNPLVENVYEMGSIIKPLTMAAGIDSGAVTATSTYTDTGTLALNGKHISNFDGKARGVIPMQEILSQSLNVGAAYVALKTGNSTFAHYFLSYGLGSTTGIDLPNEQKGNVANLFVNRDLEHATASFGQGIAMSPIATVRALSVLANGGYLVHPHIAQSIQYSIGTSKTINNETGVQVIKKSTADTVTRMLVQVVDKAISKAHPDIYMDHYSIAAKTGTAQIADHTNGGYYTDRYLHSFFGYVPAYNPKFLVFLYQVYPKGAEYASATLTDPFADITKFLVSYYEVPPDR
jgi:cell division protein FtsI (penicillin-binding protein 3)/stage V sporulation protein D (sporulation-specific penicillin-binding protein)